MNGNLTVHPLQMLLQDCESPVEPILPMSYVKGGVAFTWATSPLGVAALDAERYVDGGPWLVAMDEGGIAATGSSDPLKQRATGGRCRGWGNGGPSCSSASEGARQRMPLPT